MAMPDISTTYAPGSVSTTTQPVVSGGPFPGGDLGDLLQQVIRKRLMAAQQAPAPAAAAPQPTYRPAPQPSRALNSSKKSPLDMARERDEILQIQARQQPPPMRMVTGAGITPGYVMDTNAMNAYQRAAYLPNGSSASYSPGSQYGARNDAANEGAFDEHVIADRARTAGQAGEVGGAAPGTPGGSVSGRQQALLNQMYGRY